MTDTMIFYDEMDFNVNFLNRVVTARTRKGNEIHLYVRTSAKGFTDYVYSVNIEQEVQFAGPNLKAAIQVINHLVETI